MISSNIEQNLAISRLCADILASNERILFVSFLNKNGNVIELKFRHDGIITKMSKAETEMFFMQRTLQMSLGKEFDHLVSPLNYIAVNREILLELIFPYSKGLILVACDLDVIPYYLAKKILFILRNFDWGIPSFVYENA
ncbi:MAG: hypothetical protein KC444_07485 [Nitrosopumilus sp.]|nr:hypothetical protein [Nitrosopumilus sp.]